MGQVPQKILLVGAGRLAQTLAALYPTAQRWSRKSLQQLSQESLSSFIQKSDPSHIWLAVSDNAISELAAQHRTDFQGRTVVHFSGSLSEVDGIYSAHPLSTFSAVPQSAADFARITFILDLAGPDLSALLPGLKNSFYRLPAKDRPYYHALCAISGNFTTMLWETVARRFQDELGLPAEALSTYRDQIFKNLAAATGSVLTGPIARGDTKTIAAHHKALTEKHETSLLKIYAGFEELHLKEST